jgi:hypothetical protein
VGWESLFADLDGEFDAAEAAELAAEVEDRTRREVARLRLVDHLHVAVGQAVLVTVAHFGPLHGRLLDLGADWLLLEDSAARQVLVPLPGVLSISGLGQRAAEPENQSPVTARLQLGYVLRALARDRTAVSVMLRDGSSRTGTLDRVGADHLTIAEHAAGEVRRSAAVHGVSVIPFAALVMVRSL